MNMTISTRRMARRCRERFATPPEEPPEEPTQPEQPATASESAQDPQENVDAT
jgi:hypothetical protein